MEAHRFSAFFQVPFVVSLVDGLGHPSQLLIEFLKGDAIGSPFVASAAITFANVIAVVAYRAAFGAREGGLRFGPEDMPVLRRKRTKVIQVLLTHDRSASWLPPTWPRTS